MHIPDADPFELYNVLDTERWRIAAALVELPPQSLRARELRARQDELDAALHKIVTDAGPKACFLPCCNPLPGEIADESGREATPATVTYLAEWRKA
jgi:hypothetical protein